MSAHAPVRLALHAADGVALQAEVVVPDGPVRAAAVIAHPHPLHGGSMHASVVDALFRSWPDAGVAALRFNFRGVQGSQGRHGYGTAERADVAAAVEELARRVRDVPVVVAGWSFGADVGLGIDAERVAGWFAVAPPLRILPAEDLVAGRSGRPVLLVVPAHDQFCPPEDARARTAGWDDVTVEVVPMADHFLVAGIDHVVAAGHRFVDRLLGA